MPTSHPPISKNKRSHGFTLIEVLVVLAIIAGVTAVIVKQVRDTKSKIRVTLRQLSVLTKELHTAARFQGKTFRLAIQMDKEKGSAFWVESGYPKTLLKTEDQIEAEKKGFQGDKKEAPSEFALDPTILKNKIELPKGLLFEDVELARLKDKMTEETAYVTFFPQGLADEAAIHLTDGKEAHWTLIVYSLTGQGKILPQYTSLKDYFPQ